MKDKGSSRDILIFLLLIVVVFLLIVILALTWGSGRQADSGGDKAGTSSADQASWVGQKAPDFELEDFEGQKVSLATLKGKNVVLFFTEGLMCYPACWDQMAKLGTDPRFNNEKTVSYSVIVDPQSEWQKAFDKMPSLRQTKVLFDLYRTASRSYGALSVDSSMHRGSFPGHTYFLIDKEGVIRYFLDDPAMGIRNDLLFEQLKKIL